MGLPWITTKDKLGFESDSGQGSLVLNHDACAPVISHIRYFDDGVDEPKQPSLITYPDDAPAPLVVALLPTIDQWLHR